MFCTSSQQMMKYLKSLRGAPKVCAPTYASSTFTVCCANLYVCDLKWENINHTLNSAHWFPSIAQGKFALLIHNNKLPQSLILYWLLSVVHCINPIVSTTVKPASWIINGHISKASCHFHYRWGTILIVVLYYTKMGCGLVAEDGGFVLS